MTTTTKRVKAMQIEVAPLQRMAETGSSLLRSIQNNETPLLDLLVREAVQNSMDAALDGKGFVQVDFSIRNFDSRQLSAHFEGISERLNEIYSNDSYRLLEIRDTNTTGLTGPIQEAELKSSDYGNLIKLVYHVGMPQKKEGAGGSWGLGKTVYYRIGIGLVVFYTRVFEDGKYSSRLAACLVEDEEKEQALLANKGNHRGIAWWGKKTADGETTIPLTDEAEIKEVLDALGTKPFEHNQTGTAIIIPYLRDDLRPDQWEPDDDAAPGRSIVPWWNRDDAEYIKVALQRWYAPRLMNEKYRHGKWLRAAVNGELLSLDRFLPAFKLVQKLYNCAFVMGRQNEFKDEELDAPIYASEINLRNVFVDGSVAGWAAFGRFSSKDLKMLPPDNNHSPFVQIFGREINGDSNPAIVCFTRKPGMIVGYEYVGKWTDGISRTSKDEFTIGIFVVNSSNRLKDDFKKDGTVDYPLEEYIRDCEKADHASWQDWAPRKSNPFIIEKIQRQVRRNIENQYKTEQSDASPLQNVQLGKLLASAILPPEGFGRMGSAQKPNRGNRQGTRRVRGSAPSLYQISSPSYEHGLVKISFKLYSGKLSNQLELRLGASTESGNINAETWEQDERGTGTPFPADVFRLELVSADKGDSSKIGWHIHDGASTTGSVSLEQVVQTTVFKKNVGFRISGEKNRVYNGVIWIKTSDPLIRLSLHTAPVQEDVGA